MKPLHTFGSVVKELITGLEDGSIVLEKSMAGENGKNMSVTDFLDVLNVINKEHRWPTQGRGIKYVRPHYDTRTGSFFGITLDAIDGTKEFFVVNENRHKDLAVWVLGWLNGAEGVEPGSQSIR